jgi:predicted nuclease with TOPRIM domain
MCTRCKQEHEAADEIERLQVDLERSKDKIDRIIAENSRLRIKCGNSEMLEGDYATLLQMEEDIERVQAIVAAQEELICEYEFVTERSSYDEVSDDGDFRAILDAEDKVEKARKQ